VALVDGRVVGMLAVHDQPPFSIEEKLADPSVLRSLGPRPLEVRLLAVEPEHRHSLVLGGLGSTMLKYARAQGYSHLLISGFLDRLRMYERMGFRALGPSVRNGAVEFVPMVAHVDRMPEHIVENAERLVRRLAPPVRRMAFTPGHACNAPDVLAAAARPWVDHRGPEFLSAYEDVLARPRGPRGRHRRGALHRQRHAGQRCGRVDLASDRRLRRGLVLVNGEFGRRIAQARRAGLQTTVLAGTGAGRGPVAGGADAGARTTASTGSGACTSESSTGMLNDVGALLELLRKRRVRAVLDAVSGLGSVPLDLSGVHLASGVANKALGGVAGLCFVHAARGALDGVDGGHVPSTLDLREALATRGPRFTMGGGPLFALHAALERYAAGTARRERFASYLELGRTVARGSRRWACRRSADERAAPTITTFAPPPERRAAAGRGRRGRLHAGRRQRPTCAARLAADRDHGRRDAGRRGAAVRGAARRPRADRRRARPLVWCRPSPRGPAHELRDGSPAARSAAQLLRQGARQVAGRVPPRVRRVRARTRALLGRRRAAPALGQALRPRARLELPDRAHPLVRRAAGST
jgi:aspartate aminotransferase-like enzyme